MSGSYGMSSQEASVANEKRLKMQEKIEVLERMIEGQSLGAERDAPREGAGGGGGGGGRWGDERRSSCEGTRSVDCADNWASRPIRHVTTFFIPP